MTTAKPKVDNLNKKVMSSPVHILAFGFGSGLAPFAPGTSGTLMAIPLYLLISQLSLLGYIVVTILVCIVGIWICGKSSQKLGVHDHSGIVWDEFAGYFVTMLLAPSGWLWVAIGFILFRLFDIWKPWPISFLDRNVDGGVGIMLDDIVAGVYAFVCIQLLAYSEILGNV